MNTRVNAELVSLLKEKDEIFDVTSTLDYPTIAEVVMWLYEKHGIWISADFDSKVWYQVITVSKDCNRILQGDHDSPTEAYEAAIKYTLENLI